MISDYLKGYIEHIRREIEVFDPAFKVEALPKLDAATIVFKLSTAIPKVASNHGVVRSDATYRRLLQSLITPPVLAAWEPTIARDLRPILADLQTHPEGAYAKPGWDIFLLRSFARLFFGIHPESAGFAQLAQGFQVIKLVSDRRISVPWLPSERRTQRPTDAANRSGLPVGRTAPPT